jgi:hypothetical protein
MESLSVALFHPGSNWKYLTSMKKVIGTTKFMAELIIRINFSQTKGSLLRNP